jgi:hypothetical protein
MKLLSEIKEIEAMEINFDITLAEKKINKIFKLIEIIELDLLYDNRIERDDIVAVLKNAYGTIYEIGNTKQSLPSRRDFELAQKILGIARSIFGKSKELLPYLYLNLHNSIGDDNKHSDLLYEISQIENVS